MTNLTSVIHQLFELLKKEKKTLPIKYQMALDFDHRPIWHLHNQFHHVKISRDRNMKVGHNVISFKDSMNWTLTMNILLNKQVCKLKKQKHQIYKFKPLTILQIPEFHQQLLEFFFVDLHIFQLRNFPSAPSKLTRKKKGINPK